MKKILILTASFGDGHNAAARSVCDAIRLVDVDADARVIDLFEVAYGPLNTAMKAGYRIVVKHAPKVWARMFRMFDDPVAFRRQVKSAGKLHRVMRKLVETEAPDAIVSTYPVYSHVLANLFPDIAARRFKLFTVVTDSISVCSAWYLAHSDAFIVPNEQTGAVLLKNGVPSERVCELGFPVSPKFTQPPKFDPPLGTTPPRVLYVINTGKALVDDTLERLLELNKTCRLTITTGRDIALQKKLTERLKHFGSRVQVMGWTDQMPQMLMSHHLLIAKAGGAIVQEAIAANCPMIINQVIPGQEEGNAFLIQSLDAGVVAAPHDVPQWVQRAFANYGQLWGDWRMNLEMASRPDSSLRIAQFVLQNGVQARAEKSVARERAA
jgi:UDP-N-acetylglucosamine:LPS N-acetylglucosamine transferase